MTGAGAGLRVIATLSAAGVGALLALRVAFAPFRYSLWSDRDLWRAGQGIAALPTTGAELSYGTGARIPGGAQVAIVAFAQRVHDDPLTVQRFVYLLDAGAVVAVGLIGLRLGGPLAGALASLALLGTAVTDEGLTQLWNPAFLPLFVAAGTAVVATMAETRRAGLLWAWAVAVGLGAQMHLTMTVWAGASLVALVLLGVRGWRRALPGGLAALVLVYLPHLVDELLHGWPNLSGMGAQPHTRAIAHGGAPMTWRFAELASSLGWLGGHTPSGLLPSWAGAARWVWALGAPAGALAAWAGVRRGSDRARGLAAVVLTTGLAGGWLLTDPLIPTTVRYLLVLAPGVAVVVGVGLGALASAAGRAGPLVALLAAGATGASASWWVDRCQAPAGGEAARFLGSLDAVREVTGWSWEELAGRLVVVTDHDGERYTWAAQVGIDDVLRRHGATFEGSKPPPCGLLFQATLPDDADVPAIVARTIRTGQAGPRVIGVHVVADGIKLVVVDPGLPLCASSMIDRYLDTPVEAAMRGPGLALAPGEVTELDAAEAGTRRFVTRLLVPAHDDPTLLVAAVDLRRDGGDVEVALHSAQLRGEALNEGWYAPALAWRPRVRLEAEGVDPVEIVLVEDFVGYRAAVTPLVARGAVGPGPWRVVLVLELVDPKAEAWPPTAWKTQAVEVVLTEAWSG